MKNFKTFFFALLITFFPFFLAAILNAQAGEIIYASYKYTMGDNDTKNDARRICFLEVKRQAIEKAGTYLESTTEIRNFQLTRDEIRTFAGAIIKVDIASEEIKFIGESVTIFMTVKAEVDVDSFKERIKQIKADRELEKKVIEQQSQIREMENRIKDLKKQLATNDFDEVVKARKGRRDAFEKIDELDRMKFYIRIKTQAAIRNVKLGMTHDEVIKVAGKPQEFKIKPFLGSYKGNFDLNYGNVWVIFESDVVSCIIKEEIYGWEYDCQGYRRLYPNLVIR